MTTTTTTTTTTHQPDTQMVVTTLRGHTITFSSSRSSPSSRSIWDSLIQASLERDGYKKYKNDNLNLLLPNNIQIVQDGRYYLTPCDLANLCLQEKKLQYVALKLPVRGGIDRQNRVGSKFGGGGVSSGQQQERERKERLKQLALESIDLAKDPYLMRNHLGTYECKLCLTLHTNEANYLAHTQGKKHQQGLARRAHMEKLRAADKNQQDAALPSTGPISKQQSGVPKIVRIGRPAYQVFKSRDVDTHQRCLSFELTLPEISQGIQPRHRFMSAFEQKVDHPPDKRYQYFIVAAEPYDTIAFKIPNEPIDKEPGRFVTHWNPEDGKFTVTLYFCEPKTTQQGDNATDDNHETSAARTTPTNNMAAN